MPLGTLAYFADLGRSYTWEEERPGMFGPVTVRREPVGVVAAIVPWNVPQFLTMTSSPPPSSPAAPSCSSPRRRPRSTPTRSPR